ncbi:MAG: acylphosphatase [Armatimonadetes bacterium]|nr:acylphosphatase [Armatimonadota bacterium]
MEWKEARLVGHVQGVGYRAFVQRLAREMGISGEVWNTRAGDVELLAGHHDPVILRTFLEMIQNGPGRVTSFSHTSAAPGEPGEFVIGSTR